MRLFDAFIAHADGSGHFEDGVLSSMWRPIERWLPLCRGTLMHPLDYFEMLAQRWRNWRAGPPAPIPFLPREKRVVEIPLESTWVPGSSCDWSNS